MNNKISTFYRYNSSKSFYIFFINNGKNIYIETLLGSIIIPYNDIQKYIKLNLFYIISLQLTPDNSKVYYCKIGYKGIYKERRYWYMISNIYWKSSFMSFGDYCYFKENPFNIDISVCNTSETIKNYIALFNKTYDPYKIINWIINYEINTISKEILENELIINSGKRTYTLLGIIQRHFNITEDIILKIFLHIEEFNIINTEYTSLGTQYLNKPFIWN